MQTIGKPSKYKNIIWESLKDENVNDVESAVKMLINATHDFDEIENISIDDDGDIDMHHHWDVKDFDEMRKTLKGISDEGGVDIAVISVKGKVNGHNVVANFRTSEPYTFGYQAPEEANFRDLMESWIPRTRTVNPNKPHAQYSAWQVEDEA